MSQVASALSNAANMLRHSCHPALRYLLVEETDSAIVIRGKVKSYYLKQLAQESLMAVRGPRQLVNQVVVSA